MKKQFLLFLCFLFLSTVFSACSSQENTILDLREPAQDFGKTEAGEDERSDPAQEKPDAPQTVIPVVGKDDDTQSGDVDQDVETDSETDTPEDPEQDQTSESDMPSDEEDVLPDPDAENKAPSGVDSRVGVSVNYIYELYQDEAGADMLDLRISTPQVYYSDGIPLQNVNAYYTQYSDSYREDVETQTLKLVTEHSSSQSEIGLSTVEMGFSVTYNENWLLSVAAEENLCILGEQIERGSGHTFDTKRDARLSIWDILSQADVQDAILLPAVQQVLDALQISYDPALLVSQLDFYTFTVDSTGITFYIDCRDLNPSAKQTVQVFLSASAVSTYLQPGFTALFQTVAGDIEDKAA